MKQHRPVPKKEISQFGKMLNLMALDSRPAIYGRHFEAPNPGQLLILLKTEIAHPRGLSFEEWLEAYSIERCPDPDNCLLRIVI